MSQIIVINLGSQVAHLIARRVRELGVYCELVSHEITINEIMKMNPNGIILSGGPDSVFEKGALHIDERILEVGIPVLGICYGLQLIAQIKGGVVLGGELKEFGKKFLHVRKSGKLLKKLKGEEEIWMSHGDLVDSLPSDFRILGSTDSCKIAAFENLEDQLYGLQFHPEVVHTPKGMQILKNFVFGICNAKKDWNIGNLPKKLIAEIKNTVGDKSVIMGLSGGVDSSVAATLIHNAIGDKLHCVFIDHGLVRKNEGKS